MYAGDVATAILDLYERNLHTTINFGAGEEITIKSMIEEKDPVKQILNDPNDELIEKFVEKKKEVNDKLIENVLKWSDKVLDGIDLNEKLPDEEND